MCCVVESAISGFSSRRERDLSHSLKAEFHSIHPKRLRGRVIELVSFPWIKSFEEITSFTAECVLPFLLLVTPPTEKSTFDASLGSCTFKRVWMSSKETFSLLLIGRATKTSWTYRA